MTVRCYDIVRYLAGPLPSPIPSCDFELRPSDRSGLIPLGHLYRDVPSGQSLRRLYREGPSDMIPEASVPGRSVRSDP